MLMALYITTRDMVGAVIRLLDLQSKSEISLIMCRMSIHASIFRRWETS